MMIIWLGMVVMVFVVRDNPESVNPSPAGNHTTHKC